MAGLIAQAVDWLCPLTALAAIAAYVAALLRNRPYLRPMNSLGLLLIGAALLSLPTVIGRPIDPARAPYVAYLIVLLVGSALFQGLSAFRRRKRRESDAPAGAAPAAR
jgi:hypothetical protein